MRALVDTSALLALSRTRDQYHARAGRIAKRHVASGGRFLGTTSILGELHAHLVHLRGPQQAHEALKHLLADPVHEWADVSVELVRDASARWLHRFADQPFTLVDAVSFELMRQENISRAFAFDHHFEVAGFQLLR